ncbi:hypothetical protein E2C06_36125, partial [Dankookia rubra]
MMGGYPAAARRLLSGWRGLGVFWALVLALLGGGAGVLAWLGPPPAPPAVAEARRSAWSASPAAARPPSA